MLPSQLKPHEKYADFRPVPGDRVKCHSGSGLFSHGIVKRVEASVCYTTYPDGEDSGHFLWCFWDGLNKEHFWPTKQQVMRYFLDSQGDLWKGRIPSESNFHYAKFGGIDPDIKPIWTLSRSEADPEWQEITRKEALHHIDKNYNHHIGIKGGA